MMPEPRPPVEYATKADLDTLRRELKADLQELRLQLRADMGELKAELLKWHVGTLVAITAIYGGLVAMLKIFG
jgi:hypothetical protein